MEIFSYCVPTRVVFGRGALGQLHTLPALGKKALLVTSGGKSYKLNGSFDKRTASTSSSPSAAAPSWMPPRPSPC